MRVHIPVTCLVALAFATPRAQQPELRTATTSVLFDVVVRDGKSFELQEDGAACHVVHRSGYWAVAVTP